MTSPLLISEPPLQVLPTLAVLVGLNEAIFIQQLHYWLQKPSAHEIDGERWVYNTLAQWQEQLPFWSERTLKRIVADLAERGLVVRKNFNKDRRDRTWWYTINYKVLDVIMDEGYSKIRYGTLQSDNLAPSREGQPGTLQSDNLAPSLMYTETTSETTSETTHTQNARACEENSASRSDGGKERRKLFTWQCLCPHPNDEGLLCREALHHEGMHANEESGMRIAWSQGIKDEDGLATGINDGPRLPDIECDHCGSTWPSGDVRAERHRPGCIKLATGEDIVFPESHGCMQYHPGLPCEHEQEVLSAVRGVLWPDRATLPKSHLSVRAFAHRYHKSLERVGAACKLAEWWKKTRKPRDWTIPLMFADPETELANAQSVQAPGGATGLARYVEKLKEERE